MYAFYKAVILEVGTITQCARSFTSFYGSPLKNESHKMHVYTFKIKCQRLRSPYKLRTQNAPQLTDS